jgi:hypothetical protein
MITNAENSLPDNSKLVNFTPEQLAKFWSRVKKTESCWIWTGHKLVSGYGLISLNGIRGPTILAHRMSWEIHNGEPLGKRKACHHCDNPPCVNPEHIFAGSQRDNIMDMVRKKRQNFENNVRGERCHLSKLKEQQVIEIRNSIPSSGRGSARIARKYGVSRDLIRLILRRKIWTHI